jgi:hypothetical protein
MSGTTDIVTAGIAEIEHTMRADPAAYWRDQGMQERYRGRIDSKLTGAPPPAAPSARDRAIADIERTMRTQPARYFRDPKLQARYRSLLAAREGMPDTTTPRGGDMAAEARRSLPAATVAEWDAADGFEAGLARLQGAAGMVAQVIGDEEAARAVFASFQALPRHARAAMLRECGRPEPGYVSR